MPILFAPLRLPKQPGLSDPGEKFKTKTKSASGSSFGTPFTPISAFAKPRGGFQCFSVVRMHRNGRVSSLFSTERRIPKLDVLRKLHRARATFGTLYESDRRQW